VIQPKDMTDPSGRVPAPRLWLFPVGTAVSSVARDYTNSVHQRLAASTAGFDEGRSLWGQSVTVCHLNGSLRLRDAHS
jgi:hypothetical protein